MKYSGIFSILLFFVLPIVTICQESKPTGVGPTLNPVEYSNDIFYRTLPDTLAESSGLMFWDGLLWTHNDGGNNAFVYGIDTATGHIRKTLHVKGAKNYDWEDMTQDAGYIFVGDIGNNSGALRETAIYKIHKGSITDDREDVFVHAEEIAFKYMDHDGGKKKPHGHNFDCEALFEFEEQLYLFTKNWADHKTRMYSMPTKPDLYHIEPQATFDVGGLITGADISSSGKRVAMIGYVDFMPFIWLFWDFKGDDFFGGKKLRVDLPDLAFVQTEAITFTSEDELFISCEASAEPQSLFKVKFSELTRAGEKSDDVSNQQLIVPGTAERSSKKELKVSFALDADADVRVELYNSRWELIGQEQYANGSSEQPSVTFTSKGFKDGSYFVKYILLDESGEDNENSAHAVIDRIKLIK